MTRLAAPIIGAASVLVLVQLYRAALDIPQSLSPQGCRMSRMSPSYIVQAGFDASWVPASLARRYELSLYREVAWESNHVNGVPVLFIPGNAGSAHQVRSIASSATRQYYSMPYQIAPEFEGRDLKPLDFFAVDFNEDLSAFHGPTLDSQITYSAGAINYILAMYPANTSIIVMGHSMGGIVATSLLKSDKVSAVITMSTPHMLPPARFDARIDKIYKENEGLLRSHPAPILSLCGGATDMMVPSESCILPEADTSMAQTPYRRTVFTSALEGAWTGVGHREMVWCHQVRWRVARVALELGAAETPSARGTILDAWLRDGQGSLIEATSDHQSLAAPRPYEILPEDIHLVLKEPQGSILYLLPHPKKAAQGDLRFVLYASQGSISPVAPQHPLPLRVSIYTCHLDGTIEVTSPSCDRLQPAILKLLPNPIPGQPFPVPNEGSDESEGVVFFEATVPHMADGQSGLIGVKVEDADGRGWIVGGFISSGEEHIESTAGTSSTIIGTLSLTIPTPQTSSTLRTEVILPNLLSNALVVYRLTPKFPPNYTSQACSDPLLPPLLMHRSDVSESHYFPLEEFKSVHLHAHSSAPYIPSRRPVLRRGLNLTMYSLGAARCDLSGVDITVDWWASFGRWATRYPTTMTTWAAGIVALLVFRTFAVSDNGAVPSVGQSLVDFTSSWLPKLSLLFLLFAFAPLPPDYYTGNGGDPLLAIVAPMLLVTVFGVVCVSWWTLSLCLWISGRLWRKRSQRPRTMVGVRKGTLVSLCLVFLLIFVFVPWQVAFLGCWPIHFYTCASSAPSSPVKAPAGATAIPLIRVSAPTENDAFESRTENELEEPVNPSPITSGQSPPMHPHAVNNYHYYTHILLLMTWLLPLVAPVLAVWVRTLLTAGFTTPFTGDHNFLNVAPFLVFVDFASWMPEPAFTARSFESKLSVRWCFLVAAVVAFLIGPSQAHKVFDAANVAVAAMLVVRVGGRYWGGSTAWAETSRRQ